MRERISRNCKRSGEDCGCLDAAQSFTTHFDALIIGAGFSGRYMLHSLRDKLGLSPRVLEAGARCDTPSYIYCFTFDRNQPLDGAHRAG
jgi:cation diffusion facilitator CzcD-associated flavoprotein CzcO